MKIKYSKKESINQYVVKCLRFKTSLIKCNKPSEHKDKDIDNWEFEWSEMCNPILLDYLTANKIVTDLNQKIGFIDFILVNINDNK